MAKARVTTVVAEKSHRYRLDLRGDDNAHLEAAAEKFGLPKSELVRRLIRAAVGIGPALSTENAAAIVVLANQLRPVGRNLAQVVKGINIGHAPQLSDAEPILVNLHAAVSTISSELSDMTVAYGSKLRRAAGLKPLGGQ